MDIQELLDLEANLDNTRRNIHRLIKDQRGPNPPACWGQDDCSAMILMRCPWRVDCGEQDSIVWMKRKESE
jgi:hypothetical protein